MIVLGSGNGRRSLLAGLAILVRELGKLLETPERDAVVVKRG
jgi:hypothetical protein